MCDTVGFVPGLEMGERQRERLEDGVVGGTERAVGEL